MDYTKNIFLTTKRGKIWPAFVRADFYERNLQPFVDRLRNGIAKRDDAALFKSAV